ncbi:MAG TPA: hypothetical protein VHY19_09650 [Steroidobacteraceae bacterium]|jgi:quinol monooxygenase YgiN|nr:hypothetical protein [Steroidobacteraceae bacterium]
MAILLKIRWEIKAGREREFRENQERLCAVMRAEHPGVVCYHVDYPSAALSEWTEIYANNDVFKAHLANSKGQGPLQALVGLCDDIVCRCWGDPDAQSKELLVGFDAVYEDTAEAAYVLHPQADAKSKV